MQSLKKYRWFKPYRDLDVTNCRIYPTAALELKILLLFLVMCMSRYIETIFRWSMTFLFLHKLFISISLSILVKALIFYYFFNNLLHKNIRTSILVYEKYEKTFHRIFQNFNIEYKWVSFPPLCSFSDRLRCYVIETE